MMKCHIFLDVELKPGSSIANVSETNKKTPVCTVKNI